MWLTFENSYDATFCVKLNQSPKIAVMGKTNIESNKNVMVRLILMNLGGLIDSIYKTLSRKLYLENSKSAYLTGDQSLCQLKKQSYLQEF